MPKQYPRELRERAVRLVAEHRGDYDTEYAAMAAAQSPNLRAGAPVMAWTVVFTVSGWSTNHSHAFTAALAKPASPQAAASASTATSFGSSSMSS